MYIFDFEGVVMPIQLYIIRIFGLHVKCKNISMIRKRQKRFVSGEEGMNDEFKVTVINSTFIYCMNV